MEDITLLEGGEYNVDTWGNNCRTDLIVNQNSRKDTREPKLRQVNPHILSYDALIARRSIKSLIF